MSVAPAQPVTVLSLATGVGGIELGLRLAGLRTRLVCAVERDPYAAAVLLARMEDETLEPAPVWCGNLEQFDARPFAGVALVTAGYPCPGQSTAGKRLGQRDPRWLWPEVARVVSDAMKDLSWLDRIACAGLDPDIFFPERGERAEAAKVVCRTCPVASQCQEFRKGEAGIWGGQSDSDRRKQRKESRMSEETVSKQKNLVLRIEVPGIWADDLDKQAAEWADGQPVTDEHRLDALLEWMRCEVGITVASVPAEKNQNHEFEIHAFDGSIVGAELREVDL